MTEEDKEPLSLEPQPTIKILQTIKVVGRTVMCSRCDRDKGKVATNYCPCGSFLCFLHAVSHWCPVQSILEYSDQLLEALA